MSSLVCNAYDNLISTGPVDGLETLAPRLRYPLPFVVFAAARGSVSYEFATLTSHWHVPQGGRDAWSFLDESNDVNTAGGCSRIRRARNATAKANGEDKQGGGRGAGHDLGPRNAAKYGRR